MVAVVLVTLSKSEFSSAVLGTPKAAHSQAHDSDPDGGTGHTQ